MSPRREPRRHVDIKRLDTDIVERQIGAMHTAQTPKITALTFILAASLAACSGTAEAPRATVEETPAPTSAPTPAAGERPAAAPVASVRLPFGPQTQSKVEFVGAKITATHDGSFERFAGNIELVPGHIEQSRVNVDIEMESLKIEPARLAGHLRTADFFDVAQYPRTTFTSTSIVAGGANGATHTITGTLAMHGASKQISFPATIAESPTEVTARAEFVINRRDFNIVYPGMPDDLIKDDVTIKLTIRAPRS